jgi:hypothetical protein
MSLVLDFVAGPVHVDGHELNFFVELKKPQAAMEVLAASYTALFMREKAQELMFSAYENRRSRLSEDDWYAIAKEHFDLHLQALREDPETLTTVRKLVKERYFKNRVPAELVGWLNNATASPSQGVFHAA